MSNIVDRLQGVNYNQPNTPVDAKRGKLWWNTDLTRLQGANGVNWIGALVGTAGYTGYQNTMNKLTFSSETVASHASSFINGRRGASSLIAGYSFGCGATGSSAHVGKLLFSSGVTSTIVSALTETIAAQGGADSDSAGYKFAGDVNTVVGVATNRIDKLTFSGETVASLVTGLTPSTDNFNCGTESSTKGYNWAGRWQASFYTSIQSLTFSGDTLASVTSVQTQAYVGACGVNGTVNGYIAGSQTSSTTRIDKMVFSSESVASLAAGITPGRFLAGPINSKINGYICGGSGSSTVIDRIVFATDAVSVLGSGLVQSVTYSQFGCEDLN